MNNSFKYFAFAISLLAMVSCTEDSITPDVGQLADETAMSIIGGQLRSERDLSNMVTISLYEGDKPDSEQISYALTKPATNVLTLKTITDETLVDAYNLEHKTKLEALPVANVSIENDGTLTIAAGKQTSAPIEISISTEGLETEKTYLLALTIAEAVANVEAQSEKQKLYYSVYIQKKETTSEPDFGVIQEIPELLSNVTSVFYVNTETYQPLVVAAWGVKTGYTYYSIGNIVNLKTATIHYDASNGRTLFSPGNDLSYVLEHSDKYIRPLQDYGRKVCLCIENGGKGVGFCNMNDTQIADFVRQVKEVITRYNFLDGVNLWDEDSKYGKAGMPEMNTTSYPKLIKALREALPGKLLTLVDKGDATEYFYDVAKCGGIEVGKYIDYAWHGYFSPTEDLQIINPDPVGSTQTYSKYMRKPIAGLDETSYGSVNIPRYSVYTPAIRNLAAENICKWKTAGNKKSNILVFGSDLIGNEYGDRENAVAQMLSSYGFTVFMDDGWTWDFDNKKFITSGKTFYNSGALNYLVAGNPDLNPYKKDW